MEKRFRDIHGIAISRGIEFLFHYTPACNFEDILRYGIMPRTMLSDSAAIATVLDEYRLDDRPDAVSVSLSRVNRKLLARKRIKMPGVEWIILAIDASVLWTQRVEFCWTDAASNIIKHHSGRRDGPWAFNRMFEGSAEQRAGLLDCHATASEAEIHVLGRIDQSNILGAVVASEKMRKPVEEVFKELLPESAHVEVVGF